MVQKEINAEQTPVGAPEIQFRISTNLAERYEYLKQNPDKTDDPSITPEVEMRWHLEEVLSIHRRTLNSELSAEFDSYPISFHQMVVETLFNKVDYKITVKRYEEMIKDLHAVPYARKYRKLLKGLGAFLSRLKENEQLLEVETDMVLLQLAGKNKSLLERLITKYDATQIM